MHYIKVTYKVPFRRSRTKIPVITSVQSFSVSRCWLKLSAGRERNREIFHSILKIKEISELIKILLEIKKILKSVDYYHSKKKKYILCWSFESEKYFLKSLETNFLMNTFSSARGANHTLRATMEFITATDGMLSWTAAIFAAW